MTGRTAIALLVGLALLQAVPGPRMAEVRLGAAERAWQTGTWRDVKVERPKVLFNVQTRDPASSVPRTAPARETRTYVIETGTLRLELRQDATVDTPRIDMLIGQPATFAIEKKTVYVKDLAGREHRLTLRTQQKID